MKRFLAVLLILLSSYSWSYGGNEYCLAQNIWHEARGEATEEDLEPWLAVAFVTINRQRSWKWPMTICGVVWDDRQFSWTHDTLPDEVRPQDHREALLWEEILMFSRTFLKDWRYMTDPTGGADHYHADYVNPEWALTMVGTRKIGKHYYYVSR